MRDPKTRRYITAIRDRREALSQIDLAPLAGPRGRLLPGLNQSGSTMNRGSVPIKSAVIPDDNDCSAQTTPA